jgi:Protein of unknown function (DUF1559)/Domain of unknown function (DUF4190)
MIRFTCPCGKSLNASDEHAGETTRCPDCDRELTIPGVEAVQGAVAPPTANRLGGEERPPQSATSRMATVSVILGVASLCGSFFTGVPAVILGVLALRSIRRSQGRLKGNGVAIAGLVLGLFGCVVPILVLREVQYRANRLISFLNLYQMGLAMHSYAAANGTLPPAAICDANGKPLLSWRVAILPYIGEGSLYQQFKLDEPSDGPNNSKLLLLMPKTYTFPGDTTAPPGYTYYRVFVGNGAAFDSPRPSGPKGETPGVPLSDFKDGTGDTILIVEAATAVPWTKPDDLDFDPKSPLPPLGGHFSDGFQAAMADGSQRMILKSVSQQTLRAAITRKAGDVLGPDW